MFALTLLAGGFASSSPAADRDLEFVRGLRERRYFDYALLYLDQLEQRPKLAEDLKAILPYERAVTHLRNSETLRNNEARAKELDQAETYLEAFVKANPQHPLAGEAAAQRADLLLGRARVEVWQSRAAENASRKGEFQQKARQLIAKSREVFQQAHDRHKAEWDKLPKTPLGPKEAELKAARDKVETGYLRAQLDLAICTYEESQTYDAGDPAFRKTLNRAASEFETIHEKYRSQVVGLHARMWQGKCFEEQGEIGKALGIYNELLQHPGRSDTMQQLQNRVLQFRLICLNHPKSKDYQLVVQEAGNWLSQFKEHASTPVGLGIRWERARALEQLGMNKDLSETERERRLREALDDANEINRFAGEYRDPSAAMRTRINAAMHRESSGPKDFDGALALARKHVNDVAPLNDKLAAADSAGQKEELQKERVRHLQETARLLQLAMDLAQPNTDRKLVHNARYLLAFVNYELKNSYEAGILADYVARRLKKDDSEMALEAAFLSFASWQQAFFAASENSRDAELRSLARAAEYLAKTWPDSERAATTRMTLGQIQDRRKKPLEAVRWYEQIPEASDQFAAAQMAAGQAYWTAWLNTAAKRDDPAIPAADRDAWQSSAEQRLKSGISRWEKETAKGGTQPAALIAAKVSLAQIQVTKGNYPEAIRLLTEKPHAPIEAIVVNDESARPAEGIQGRPFAGLVYQLLLRAYVGAQKIDDALSAMKGLESIAGGAGGENVAAVYVSLGREIQKEIERLVAQKDETRLSQVRQSFDSFLNSLFERRQDMKSYGSLIWIAETYYGLGQGMTGDRAASDKYFHNAAETYAEILERDKTDSAFVPADREAGVRLRLVNCRKREGRFDEAFELIRAVLKDLPRALDAQFEAASLLQEWGAKEPQKYLVAIDGIASGHEQSSSATVAVWGWAQIAARLQRILASGSKSDDYRDKFAEARYNLAVCRQGFGISQSVPAEKAEKLSIALQEIEAFVLTSGEISDEWWGRFDALYRQIQKDMGKTVQPLKKRDAHVAQPVPGNISQEQPATAVSPEQPASTGKITAEVKPPRAAQRGAGSAVTYGLLTIVLLIGGGVAFFVVNGRSSRRRRVAIAAAARPEPARGTAASSKTRGAKTGSQTRGVEKP